MTLAETDPRRTAHDGRNDAGPRIRAWVLDNFPLARERGLDDADSLLDSGIVDSLGTLELISFLEREFDLVIDDEDMLADHFESIKSLTAFVDAKLAR